MTHAQETAQVSGTRFLSVCQTVTPIIRDIYGPGINSELCGICDQVPHTDGRSTNVQWTKDCKRAAGQTVHVHSQDGIIFLCDCETTSWPPSWMTSYQKALSIDAYLLKEQSSQILSWSDLKRWSALEPFFEQGHPNNNKNKMSSNVGSVSDPKR